MPIRRVPCANPGHTKHGLIFNDSDIQHKEQVCSRIANIHNKQQQAGNCA